MVKGDILVLDKKLNFNHEFTDPCMFRTKKLRLVALVHGQPCVKAIKESRSETITIPDGSENAVEEIECAEVDESPAHARGHGAAGLVVTDITKEFNALKPLLPFQGIPTEPFMRACEVVAAFSSLFGTSFLPVRANVTDNVVKIRAQVSRVQKSGQAVPADLSGLILDEVKAGTAKKDGTACVSCLWLKRSLDFLNVFLQALVMDGADTSSAAAGAYKTALEPWHGMALKLACRTAFKMVPARTTFLNSCRNGNADDAALLSELEVMLKALSPVVDAMDKWFDENALNFSDKA